MITETEIFGSIYTNENNTETNKTCCQKNSQTKTKMNFNTKISLVSTSVTKQCSLVVLAKGRWCSGDEKVTEDMTERNGSLPTSCRLYTGCCCLTAYKAGISSGCDRPTLISKDGTAYRNQKVSGLWTYQRRTAAEFNDGVNNDRHRQQSATSLTEVGRLVYRACISLLFASCRRLGGHITRRDGHAHRNESLFRRTGAGWRCEPSFARRGLRGWPIDCDKTTNWPWPEICRIITTKRHGR